MIKNRMAEVAAMFGKKLGESFTVRVGTNIASACVFKNNGLFCEGRPCEIMLWDLLTGRAEIVEG